MKKIISLCIFIPLLCAGACLLYCNTADPKLVAYYRDESNYIQVVGEVTEIYDDPKYGITFALSNPVVALSVDDVDLLLFDDGFPNWNEFYVKNRKR